MMSTYDNKASEIRQMLSKKKIGYNEAYQYAWQWCDLADASHNDKARDLLLELIGEIESAHSKRQGA